ncbi:MAG: hypothetical protein A2046_00325 [Bacteroidetes bacterium GWA2_30_7]|nr:MAG: hypothetical protein A2046_00325 [Bacteroidetes bacterium GWA2_30_7]
MTKLFKIISILFFIANFAFSQKVRKIEIINSDVLMFDEAVSKDYRRLIGNVQLKHETTLMYCDSAHLYTDGNYFDAFSNVHIIQGDTFHIYGDFLNYDGNLKFSKIRRNVKLINKESILTTDSLDYDRNTEISHYFYQGKIVDNDNVLTSTHGYYHSKTDDYYSIDKVKLVNPDFVMYCDTLRYNTESDIAFFLGPTRIIGDSNLIYCENGWYNTKTNISQYNKNAYLEKGSQRIKGDSLYYDRDRKYGKAFNNVSVIDSSENIILKGHYAYYNEINENSLLTDSTLMIQIKERQDTVYTIDSTEIENIIQKRELVTVYDSLVLHSDTLRSILIKDSVGNYKILKAYNHVKVFKSDFQAMCDSLTYNLKDSVIRLFRTPVLWSGLNQLTANFIEIHTKNGKPDFIVLDSLGFIISKEDSIKYNQIKGKKITGYFKDDELNKIVVEGNGQTLYYPKDDEEVIGVNKAICSNLIIYVKDGGFDKILFLTLPDATLYPTEELPETELRMKDFNWYDYMRPINIFDVFRWK